MDTGPFDYRAENNEKADIHCHGTITHSRSLSYPTKLLTSISLYKNDKLYIYIYVLIEGL